ncbi:MAG: hypothetical protein QW666_02220 [Candidatus Woesearchaeota archaeon]
MRVEDLPIKFMTIEISCPRQDLLDRLNALQITNYVLNNYVSPEDRADAFDGAFVAAHLELHLRKGANETDALDEILGWYDNYHKNTQGPFFDTLHTTLASMDLEHIYTKAIDYIIDLMRNND